MADKKNQPDTFTFTSNINNKHCDFGQEGTSQYLEETGAEWSVKSASSTPLYLLPSAILIPAGSSSEAAWWKCSSGDNKADLC